MHPFPTHLHPSASLPKIKPKATITDGTWLATYYNNRDQLIDEDEVSIEERLQQEFQTHQNVQSASSPYEVFDREEEFQSQRRNNEDKEQLEEVEYGGNYEDRPSSAIPRVSIWDKRYQELLEFHSKFGVANVSRTTCHKYPQYRSLASWILNQRTQYRYLLEMKPSTLTPARIALLNDIGFIWTFGSKSTWSQKYEEIAQFKKVYGHCNVPPDYSPNPRLATWAAQQRNQYRYFLDGKPSSITVERKEMLDQLDFGWSYKPERRKRKKQCTTYSNKEGNGTVSKPTYVPSSAIQKQIMYEIPTFPPPTCIPSDTNSTSFTYFVSVNQSFRFFEQDSVVLEPPTREEASRTRKKRTEVMIARRLGFYRKRLESMTKPAILKAIKTVYTSEEEEGTSKKDQLIDVQTSIISTNPLKVPKVNISHPVPDDQSISPSLSLESSSPTISSMKTETKAVKSTKSSKSNSTKNKKPKTNKGKKGCNKKWSMHNAELPDGNDAESKRQRKLIRNRLAAQLHRNRSRDYLESLKQEIKHRDDRISRLEEKARGHRTQKDLMRAEFDILRRHFGDSMIDRILKSQTVHDKETEDAS